MGLSAHQSTVGKSQVHLTPRWLLDPLGPFDLDPCAATVRPWDCARRNFVEAEDGLAREWRGRVFCNPPFDSRVAGKWVARLAEHGEGVLLIHARTETKWFRPIWAHASAILFLFRRVNFCQPDGQPTTVLDKRSGVYRRASSGAPVVLAAFGGGNAEVLAHCGLAGALVREWDRGFASPAMRPEADHA